MILQSAKDSISAHHQQQQDDVPSKKQTNKNSADDLLTIFSERTTVKFCSPDGQVATKVGRWCKECRSVTCSL